MAGQCVTVSSAVIEPIIGPSKAGRTAVSRARAGLGESPDRPRLRLVPPLASSRRSVARPAVSVPPRPQPLSPQPLSPHPLSPHPLRSQPLRLTRRGRVLLRLVFIVVAAVLAMTVAVQTQAAMGESSGQHRDSVVVAPGDTLWSIAARHADDGRLSDAVSRISRLNDLRGVRIEPGQRLVLP